MSDVGTMVGRVRRWSLRHWVVVIGVATVTVLVVGVPTDLVDTPLFSRMVPPTWWAWPGLIVSASLAGMLAATYVRKPDADPSTSDLETDPTAADRTTTRGGYVGAALTYFAVGCPVCNKLVLLALGASGAVTWFAPVQPALQLLAVGLLAWALIRRLDRQEACPVPEPVARR